METSAPPKAVTDNEPNRELSFTNVYSLGEKGFLKKFEPDNFHFFKSKSEAVDIAKGTLKLVNSIKLNNIDTIYFLDQSARPICTILNSMGREIPGFKLPEINFIELERLKHRWPLETKIEDREIRSIRESYGHSTNNNVLVVNEFSWGGWTLHDANIILRKSFPNSKIHLAKVMENTPSWWMLDKDSKHTLLGVTDETTIFEKVLDKLKIGRPSFTVKPYRNNQNQINLFRSELERLGKIAAESMQLESTNEPLRFTNEVEYINLKK